MNYQVIPGLKERSPFGEVYREGKYVMDSEKIINVICGHYQVNPKELKKKNRQTLIIKTRRMVYYFLRRYTYLNLKEIGEMMGGQDHTTVIHGLNTLKDLRWAYPELEVEILQIDNKL